MKWYHLDVRDMTEVEYQRYYAMADAMMVTLTADPFIGMTLPAKVQSYMAAGYPGGDGLVLGSAVHKAAPS